MAVSAQQSVAALYVAIFNRAPDQAGLNYWTAQVNGGVAFTQIAAGFAQHEVFTTGIGALNNAAYVAALYTNILGSAGDTAGLAYWTSRLSGGESKASVAAEFIQGSLNIDLAALKASGALSQTDYDLALIRQKSLLNKSEVGVYYAETLGSRSNLNASTVATSKASLEADAAYNASKAAIAPVTADAGSVTTAKATILANAMASGSTFTLTSAPDIATQSTIDLLGTPGTEHIQDFGFV